MRSPEARRVLVALGGAPSDEVSSLVSEALAHPSVADLDVRYLEGVHDVATAMAGADLALSASGTTCWELCCMGLPAVLLPVAANQEPLAAAMHRSCIAHNAGPLSSVTPALLAAAVADLARDRDRRVEMAPPAAMADADLALSASGTTSGSSAAWDCLRSCSRWPPTRSRSPPPCTAAASPTTPVRCRASPPAGLAAAVADLAGDHDRRVEMARRGPQLVDGRGARRVVTRMRSHLIELRAVREDDARLLWEWVNDPVVRASAFNSEPIGWDTHVGWLAARLANPFAHLYLASDAEGTPLGQVRFEGEQMIGHRRGALRQRGAGVPGRGLGTGPDRRRRPPAVRGDVRAGRPRQGQAGERTLPVGVRGRRLRPGPRPS